MPNTGSGGLASAIGGRVARRREALGWTSGRLAEAAGLGYGVVPAIEAGRRLPTMTESAGLARALAESEMWLLWGGADDTRGR